MNNFGDRKKVLIFHPSLAPYRIDQFNAISDLYHLEVVFVFDNVWNHNFDQTKLLSQLDFNYSFLLKGPSYKGRVFRFGMLNVIRRFNPDIILGYEYSFTTQYLIMLKRLGLIQQYIGSTIDDSIDICNHVQSKIRNFARRSTVRQLDFLVVLSSEVSLFYQKTFKLRDNQIIISPILQKAERLRKKKSELENTANGYQNKYQLKNKKVLLFVGRFITEKALPRFINNVHSLLRQSEGLIFIMVGDGDERNLIQEAIEKNDLNTKVLLPGRFEGIDLYSWYLCASGFVLPSTHEAFGAVINEALIFGLPVFCSQYAGASSIVNDEFSLIFNPLDEEETNDKLRAFIENAEYVGAIDLLKRNSLMKYNQSEFMNQWQKLKHG
jgi:glycosyltransferase involved in cell wall biosynthesis